MTPLRCIIVDDEPLAHRVIENFVQDLSFLQIVRKCKNALEARSALHEEEVDLMFLDIEMPKLSGLSLMRSLKRPPLVIFTTAYADHALESYELEAVDYLKKPFSFERFSQALEKVQRRLGGDTSGAAVLSPGAAIEAGGRDGVADTRSPVEVAASNALFVKSEGATRRVDLANVTILESLGDYVKVWGADRAMTSHQTLRQWEERLPSTAFLRVHKSFIVAIAKIDAIEGSELVMRGRRVPIGRSYRKELRERIGEF